MTTPHNPAAIALSHNFVPTIAPNYLAVTIITFLQGVISVQFYDYVKFFPNDRTYTKVIVYLAFIVSIVKFFYGHSRNWQFYIIHFGDWDYAVSWQSNAIPYGFSSTIPSAICQMFYIHRTFNLGRNWIFLVLAILTMLLSLVGSFVQAWGVSQLIGGDALVVPIILKSANVMVIGALACDILITGFTIWFLVRSRTGFKATDNIVSTLIRSSLESAALPTVWATINVVLNFYNVGNQWFLLFNFAMSHIYVFSLMYTVNSRLRLGGGGTQPSSIGNTRQAYVQSGNRGEVALQSMQNRRQQDSHLATTATQVYVDVDVEVQREDEKKSRGIDVESFEDKRQHVRMA